MDTTSSTRLRRPETVRVLDRGLEIIRAFVPRNDWLTNKALSTMLDLPRPTVSRLTSNLTEMGYLEYADDTGRYRLSTAVLALGFLAASNISIRALARRPMQEFADREGAVVVLGRKDKLWMVCDEVCHSNSTMLTLRVNVESRLRLPNSVMGHALLGSATREQRAVVLEDIRAEHGGDWSAFESLVAESAVQLREKGYCISIGTLEASVNGVGTPISVPDHPPDFALGCAGPAFLFPRKRLEEDLGPKLLQMKRVIESELRAHALQPSGRDGAAA